MSNFSGPDAPNFGRGFYLLLFAIYVIVFIWLWNLTEEIDAEGEMLIRVIKTVIFAAICTATLVAPILRITFGPLNEDQFVPGIPLLTGILFLSFLCEVLDLNIIASSILSIIFWALYKKWLFGGAGD